MAISTLRKVTDDDVTRLEKAANRFAKRWQIKIGDDETALEAVGFESQYDPHGRLAAAWRKCFARALRVAPSVSLTIAYGYVGHYAD